MTKLFKCLLLVSLLGCRVQSTKENPWTVEEQYMKTIGNVSFTFPGNGHAFKNRDRYVKECLDAIKSDCVMVGLSSYTDTITIQFLRNRQEMKKYTGLTAGGIPMIQPKIVYLVSNDDPKEGRPPIKHELMHLITMTTWGFPGQDSNWMNEGLAAYAENDCNGYTDEQVYRYLLEKNMLVDMTALTTSFYRQPEMIAYHQAAYIVQQLLSKYGIEKFKNLWAQGFASFETVYGVSFEQFQNSLNKTVRQDLPNAPNIDWNSFKEGCL